MIQLLLFFLIVFMIICFWIILYDTNRFVIIKHEIHDKRIKGCYKAVVLADLHNKQYGKDNEILLNAIRKQNPDAIWIAGDMLVAHPKKTIDRAISFLTVLSKEYPIFYGNGNHEHRIKLYPDTYGEMAKEYEEALNRIRIQPLVNEHIDLPNKNISIYGSEIEKYYYKRFAIPKMNQEYMQSILGQPDQSKYKILIAHNPDYFENYANWGADLVLSGHVHGGIVRLPFGKGILSPGVRLFPKYDGGVYVNNQCKMIVSRGLGVHTIPIRLFNPAELIVVEMTEQ